MQVICDNCDEIYFNRIFDPDATVEHPWRLNVSPIPVQIVESRGAPSSYAVLKKFHEFAWWKF